MTIPEAISPVIEHWHLVLSVTLFVWLVAMAGRPTVCSLQRWAGDGHEHLDQGLLGDVARELRRSQRWPLLNAANGFLCYIGYLVFCHAFPHLPCWYGWLTAGVVAAVLAHRLLAAEKRHALRCLRERLAAQLG